MELRKRSLALAYSVDKALATFVGRPPRISRRYCSIQVPLDLALEELSIDENEYNATVSALDVNGWRRHDKMGRSSYLRTFVIVSLIREDILELSLGPTSNDTHAIGL